MPKNDSPPPADEPQITKRLVIMKNARLNSEGVLVEEECRDYVRPDIVEAYVADAQTRWQFVSVEGLDAGPAGYHGETIVPATLNHPLAGQMFPATNTNTEA